MKKNNRDDRDDGLEKIPMMAAFVLIVFSCVLSAMPSPWSYILLIPAIPISVVLAWYISTRDWEHTEE